MVTLNFFPPCLRNTAWPAGCLMSVSSKIKVGSLIVYRGYLSVLCLHVPYTHKLVSATFIVHYFTTAIYLSATFIWPPPGVILSIVKQKRPQFSFVQDTLSFISLLKVFFYIMSILRFLHIS